MFFFACKWDDDSKYSWWLFQRCFIWPYFSVGGWPSTSNVRWALNLERGASFCPETIHFTAGRASAHSRFNMNKCDRNHVQTWCQISICRFGNIDMLPDGCWTCARSIVVFAVCPWTGDRPFSVFANMSVSSNICTGTNQSALPIHKNHHLTYHDTVIYL